MNLNSIIEKIKVLKGLSNNEEVAKILGISPQNFSNRKKRDTLLPLILEWAIHENVNLEWLFREEKGTLVADPSEGYSPKSRVVKLIDKMLADMPEKDQRDVLKYAEEKKLLGEFLQKKSSR